MVFNLQGENDPEIGMAEVRNGQREERNYKRRTKQPCKKAAEDRLVLITPPNVIIYFPIT